VDNFEKLKEKASKFLTQQKMEMEIQTRRLGKKILELYNISKSFDDLKIVDDFSYKFSRFEKIGIVGNNGSGKTTFLNLITENLIADSGHIEMGETVVFGYYKQGGIKIDEGKKVIEVIKDISESITLGNGRIMSALQFLEYFLFDAKMHYSQVNKLSGGEKRRLYLMTVLMQNPNFLILDEPTNDLDIMTLNVLEDYLLNFSGCLIIVSHDRFFMDKVVDNLFVFEGNGKIKNYPSNYSDYYSLKKEQEKEQKTQEKEIKPDKAKPQKDKAKKLSFKEKQEFEILEKEIQTLETEKKEIENLLSSGSLNTSQIIQKSERISFIIKILDEKEMRWLELSEIES
jgi:ATP-binding cassette subfamily F protein uup